MINCTQDQFIHLPHIMRIFLHQKAKVIDVPLSILPSWGSIDTYSKIDSKNSVNVFHREVGIINSKKTTCTGNEHLPRMMKTTVTNTRLLERKSNGRNETLRKSNGNQPPTEGISEWASLYIIYTHTLTTYFTVQFEIDFHIFTDIKISFNL